MSSTLACLMCSIDPQTTSLLVPMAQATIITAPFFLRGKIQAGMRALRDRRPDPAEPDDQAAPEAALPASGDDPTAATPNDRTDR